MPVVPDNPEVCRVVMKYHRDTREFQNVFHVRLVGGWVFSDMVALAGSFKDWWNTSYKTTQTADIALFEVQVRLLDPSAPLAVDLPVSPAIPGSNGVTTESGNVTETISWRTGLAGRAYRGRTYVPTMREDMVNEDDSVKSAQVAGLASVANALAADILPALAKLVIFHTPIAGDPKPLDNTANDVLFAIIENIIDSQRRRLPGRGR